VTAEVVIGLVVVQENGIVQEVPLARMVQEVVEAVKVPVGKAHRVPVQVLPAEQEPVAVTVESVFPLSIIVKRVAPYEMVLGVPVLAVAVENWVPLCKTLGLIG
jgi:hypothetical protein